MPEASSAAASGAATSGLTVGALHASLRAALASIAQVADAYAHWASLAPGLVAGPPPGVRADPDLNPANASGTSASASASAATAYAHAHAPQPLAVPLIGEVWDEVRAEHAARTTGSGAVSGSASANASAGTGANASANASGAAASGASAPAATIPDGIRGLRAIRLAIKREIEFLESYASEQHLVAHGALPAPDQQHGAPDALSALFPSSASSSSLDTTSGSGSGSGTPSAPLPLSAALARTPAPPSSNAAALVAHWELLLAGALGVGTAEERTGGSGGSSAATLVELGAVVVNKASAAAAALAAAAPEGGKAQLDPRTARRRAKQAARRPGNNDEETGLTKLDAVYNEPAPGGCPGSAPPAARQRWVKICTLKENSLLAEFRTAESYIVPDDDSSDDGEGGDGGTASAGAADPNEDAALVSCSLYKLICELGAAADLHARPSDSMAQQRPLVELVLTRLPALSASEEATAAERAAARMPAQKVYALPERERYALRVHRLHLLAGERGVAVVRAQERLARLRERQRADRAALAGAHEPLLPSDVAAARVQLDADALDAARLILPSVPLPRASALSKHGATPVPPPTSTVNLDLSALVALVSEVTHMSTDVPVTADADADTATTGVSSADVESRYLAAFKRVTPWKEQRKQAEMDGDQKHAQQPQQPGLTQGRALALQLQREARASASGAAFLSGLVATVLGSAGAADARVQLVTTAAARHKFDDILAYIAGEREKRRAAALFADSPDAAQRFWQGSRYEHDDTLRSRLQLPVKIIPEPVDLSVAPRSPFAQTAMVVLASTLKADSTATPATSVAPALAGLPTVALSASASKQTAHTVHSMLVGYALGLTTLTTNIASVRWLLKEMGRASGGLGAALLEPPSASEHALLWIAHPRSLAENMRVDADDAAVQRDALNGKLVAVSRGAGAAANTTQQTDDISVETPTPRSDSVTESKDKDLASSDSPYHYEEELAAAAVLTTAASAPRRGLLARVGRFLRGPVRPAHMTIRHYPWWPLGRVEAAWLHVTHHVRWKDPNEPDSWRYHRRGAVVDDHEKVALLPGEERDAQGDRPSWWATAVKRDLRLNWLHWLLLSLTCIGWILGFSFISKGLWYSSSIASTDPSAQTELGFYSCTATYWLQNANCGLDGASCTPFASNITQPFRCPSGCSTTTLGAPRAVGNEIVNWQPLIVGGGDAQQTYRGDSWVCASAMQAGLFTDRRGGCGVIELVGTYSDYQPKSANGFDSLGFNSTFPISYRFSTTDAATGCYDDRWKGYALDVVLSAFVGFVLQPKTIVLYWILICLGFWHINMISEPRDFPPPIGVPFGDFGPTLFGAYVIWRVAVRFVWPVFDKFPLERTVWLLGFYWLGTLLDVVFVNVPLNRIVISDLTSQPGALTSLIIIVIVVVIIAINQLRVVRKMGYLPKYLTLYITGGIIVAILSAVPGETLRLHHYVIALVLLPGTGFPTRLSLIFSSFLVGMYLNGAARWGFDGLLQDVATVRGQGLIGSDLPSFATTNTSWTGLVPTSANATLAAGTISWNPIPENLTSSWDSFALLVDDVLRYQGTATSFNLSSLLSDYEADAANFITNPLTNASLDSLEQQLASEPHYIRLSYVTQGSYGDFTRAAIAFYNGTWVDPPPGRT